MKKIYFALLTAVTFTGLAHADTTPLAFTAYTANNNGNNQTLGYEFSPSTAISVTALSYFDAGNDGLTGVHNVGLWSATGTLLASAVIPAAVAAPIQDGFRYFTLMNAVTLTPGTNYFVGGTSGTGSLDSYAQAATGVTVGSSINYLASAQMADGTGNLLTFPGTTGQTTPGAGFYGGSFLYVVPEPSTWAFLLTGGTGLLWMGLSRRLRAVNPGE